MTVDKVIMIIMAVFFTIGAFDRVLGNKLKLGKEFEKGFNLITPIALNILGLICIAPVLASIIGPAIIPFYSLIGVDPAMFSGTIFAPDAGGFAFASELSDNQKLVEFSGLIVAATIGSVISFTIPCAYAFIDKEETKYLATGLLSGLIFDPVACFFGGLIMGIPAKVVAINLIPVFAFAILIVIGLYFIPKIVFKAFRGFYYLLMVIMATGLVSGTLQQMLGITIIPGIRPLSEAFTILGNVIIVIVSAMTLFYILRKILKKPLIVISEKIGVNDITLVSIIISLTSLPPLFEEFKNMNNKGKILASACTASVSTMFGAHLAFTAAVAPAVIAPMLITKTIAGIFAIPTALFFYNKNFKDEKNKSTSVDGAIDDSKNSNH